LSGVLFPSHQELNSKMIISKFSKILEKKIRDGAIRALKLSFLALQQLFAEQGT
jgi:hypothetical protein